MKPSRLYLERLTYQVIGAAIEVHKALGPGLLESIYHQCMKEELKARNISFVSEMKIPVMYKNLNLDIDLRCDLLVSDCLVIELKAVDELHTLFDAQLLTYMKLLKVPKGILINFNSTNIFYAGQKTFVNEYFEQLVDC